MNTDNETRQKEAIKERSKFVGDILRRSSDIKKESGQRKFNIYELLFKNTNI